MAHLFSYPFFHTFFFASCAVRCLVWQIVESNRHKINMRALAQSKWHRSPIGEWKQFSWRCAGVNHTHRFHWLFPYAATSLCAISHTCPITIYVTSHRWTADSSFILNPFFFASLPLSDDCFVFIFFLIFYFFSAPAFVCIVFIHFIVVVDISPPAIVVSSRLGLNCFANIENREYTHMHKKIKCTSTTYWRSSRIRWKHI